MGDHFSKKINGCCEPFSSFLEINCSNVKKHLYILYYSSVPNLFRINTIVGHLTTSKRKRHRKEEVTKAKVMDGTRRRSFLSLPFPSPKEEKKK